MPGTFILKPIEANLTHSTELIGKMNPYCSVIVGNERIKGQICKKGGKHPHWNDAVTIPASSQSTVVLELMDHDRITHDDNIGTCMIDLSEVQSRGTVSRWYPLTYKNKPAGEILLEAVFQGDPSSYSQYAGGAGVASTFTGQQAGYQSEQLSAGYAQTGLAQTGFAQESVTSTGPVVAEQVAVESVNTSVDRSHVYIEQRQSVDTHSFTKAVDVVETRPVLKEIEVLEPVRVLKDVQYTEAVPVHKQIEVVEPTVVTKEVEVIEPRVVTKTIQVVENVPVKKQVEVIEPRTTIKEVDTFEPQTFTKQVEVIEQVPVLKTVTVTEPYTVTKAVDFVEPIITTKTITKELQQPVIVDEKITTTIGPATVVGFEQEVTQRMGQWTISEEQRRLEQRRLEEQRLASTQLGGVTSTTTTSTYQTGPTTTYQTGFVQQPLAESATYTTEPNNPANFKKL